MKLLQLTQRRFLQVAFPVFTLAGAMMYFALLWALDSEVDEKLAGVRDEVSAYAQGHDTLPVYFQTVANRLEARPISAGEANYSERYSDTVLDNPIEHEVEPFRCIQFPLKVRDQWWEITILHSIVEHEDLMISVAAMVAALFGLLFLIMVWFNRVVSRRVWQPFFIVLDKIRAFRPSSEAPFNLPESGVQEFQELNDTLQTLSQSVRQDFVAVKQFTENASHELQTPLSVIQNKVELLLQHEEMGEEALRQLNIIGQSARRMARLNESLLLLSKIENHQFAEQEAVSFKFLIERKLQWLEDFIADKALTCKLELEAQEVAANPFLAETLVANLITNAVKHNKPGGMLRIRLDRRYFLVENSAEKPPQSPEALITRFARGNGRADGLGLGLAIVDEICQQQKWNIYVRYADSCWTCRIDFPAA